MSTKLNKDIDYNKLPEPIVKSLTELIARIKLILWIRGSLATLAVVVVAVLIVMGVDAATIIISPMYRWGLSLSVLIALLIALYFYLYKPLTQPFSLNRVARFVELRHPELQERMSSIVELCRIDENSSDFGSQRLIDRLAEEATFDAKNVKPTQEINAKSVRPWFIAAGFVVGVIVLLLAIWPLRTFRLMARVIAPSSDVGSFFADTLEVEPGNLRMVKGEPLTIKVKTESPKIETAYIIKFEEDGKLVKERMIESVLDAEAEENKGLRVFTLSIPQVNESFRYCIHAGHSVTAKYEVQAEFPPQVDRFDFVYTYPEYTGLGAVLHTNALGNISVLNGTKININAYLSKPINEAKLIVASKEIADTNVTYTSQVRLKCNFVVPSDIDDKWQLNIVDHFSFTNSPKTYSIVSERDQVPTVDIYRPIEKDLILSPNGRFVINYFGFDDYGLTNAFLEVTKDGQDPDIHTLKKLEKEADKEGIWKGNVRFDLSKFDLNNVSKLSVVVCVADALPAELGGPQIARSEPIFITVDREAESLSKQSYDMQHDTIKGVLENVLKRLEDSVEDSKRINTEMSEERPDYVQVDEESSEVASDLSIVSGLLDELAGMLDETVYVGLKAGVQLARSRGVDVAKQNAEMIVMLDKDDKKATGRKLRISLEDSIIMIQNLFLDLEKLDEVVDKWLDTEELANQQEDLVEDAQDMLSDGEMLDEDWIDEQQNIADEISDALTEADPEAMKDKLEEVKKATDKLANAAEELSELQEKLGEATGDKSLEKLQNAVEDAVKNDESSEKWEEAKASIEEGDFDKGMAQAQEAVDEDAKELAKNAKELETIGDMLTDNQKLSDANSDVTDLAKKAQGETDKASDMADDIEENASETDQGQQDAMKAQQGNAAEALSAISEGLEQSKSALEEQISSLNEQIDAQQQTAQSQQPAMDVPMDDAMQAAMQAALDAQEAMDMSEMMPQSDAAQAQQAAAEAQSEALEAMTEAQNAQAKAMSSDPLDATQAQADAAQAQADAQAAQADAEAAQATAQAALDAQLPTAEMSAAKVAQAEAMVAQAEASDAQQAAAEAQASAQDAMSAAAESPSDAATASAQQAQAEAAQAQTEAKLAQQAAQQAQRQSQQLTQQADAAMMQAQQAMMQAQAAQQALSEMMDQQAQQLGMTQEQMQSMASMNQPSNQQSQEKTSSGESSDTPQNKPAPADDGVIDLELLKNIGLTLEDWEKIKGGLKSGITSEGDFDNVPAEYRALVREYFREIAGQVQGEN